MMKYCLILISCIAGVTYSTCAQTKFITQNPEFNTTSQSMWGPSASPGLNKKFVIFPEYSVHQPFSTESFTLLSFAGLDFGAVLDGYIAFGVGPFEFDISGFTSGDIEVHYPAIVTLEMPDDDTFNPGETIVIKSSFQAAPGAELLTTYPAAGKIGLYMGVMFDVAFGFKACFIDCTPRISLVPPPGVNITPPIVDKRFTFFEVSDDSLTYICDNTMNPIAFAQNPYQCYVTSGFPPWTITPGGKDAFEGTMEIPNVETTSSIVNNRDLEAVGADPYLTATVDLVNLLGYLPPPVRLVTEIIHGDFSQKFVPDVTGEMRGINVHWSLLDIDLDLPLRQSQAFKFEPRIFTTLTFPDTVDYVIHSMRRGTVSGRGTSTEFEVGDSLSVRFPCNYDFMDIYTTHRITNKFRNKTYDNISLELDFEAISFGVSIDPYYIIPEICIPLPFIGDLCIGPIGFPGAGFDVGPLIDPEPLTLVSQDFPPYFESEWELGGFNTFVVEDSFRLKPRERAVNFNVTHVTCNGDSTGTIETVIADASAPLKYEWSFGSTVADPLDVPAGSHYLKLTDANRCESIEPVQVLQPAAIDIVIENTTILCNGETSTLTSTASGGTGALSFAWNSGESTAVINGKTMGEYFVTVADASGCIGIDSVTVTQPNPLVTKIASAIDPTCANAEDGSMTLFVEGGTAPYIFQWSNGSSTRDQQQLEGGNYTITVTDANDCIATDSHTLIEPSLLVATLSKLSDVSCYGGNDGRLQVNVVGGTPPYVYRWYDSLVTLSDVTPLVNGLDRGSYSVEVTDSRECQSVRNVEVLQPSRPLQADINPVPGPCNNQSSGRLDLTVQGGTPPYQYAWSTGQTIEDLLNVPAGRYEVTVRDAEGCENRNKTLLADPDPLQLIISAEDVSCADQQDGRIALANVKGGVSPYQILWSNGETGEFIEELAEGTYSVTVRDAVGCESTEDRTIGKRDIDCLFIPNTFSPNGDDTNDTWNIRNIHLYPQVAIQVFNKWGNLVFESTGYEDAWDGNHKGKPLEPSTYYYVVNLHNGTPVYQGFLVLLK